MSPAQLWTEHEAHEWKEYPPCVYCVTCVPSVRLYQGSIPAARDPELAAKRAACSHDRHLMDDDGYEHGQGFYWICDDCGFKGWYE